MIYFSWATQIILAIISFLWLIPYYIAFKVGNRKYMSKTLDLSCNNRYTLMYYSGFFISILWYIMPFLNQPRFKLNIFSLFDIKVILLENVLYNIILIALIGYFMSVWGTKVVNCNLQATKDRFLHPSKLITEGPYKKVRNPMIMGDLFCHLSFILLLGAIHTLCLYIIYICINLVIVYIENKYSLCIHFKKEYEEYAKKTPAYMNQELWLFAIFYLVINKSVASLPWNFIELVNSSSENTSSTRTSKSIGYLVKNEYNFLRCSLYLSFSAILKLSIRDFKVLPQIKIVEG